MNHTILFLVLAALSVALSEGQKINKCEDRLRSCHVYHKKTYCLSKKYRPFMEKFCENYCGFCNCNNWAYGCCRDRKTHADGPNGKGCANKLCYDEFVNSCPEYKRNGTCGSHSPFTRAVMKERCPYSCGFCKHLAPSKRECLKSRYGCCWDGTIALGLNQKGCRPCVDSFPHPCKEFATPGRCSKTGAYYTRTFLEKYCPKACGECPVLGCHDKAGEIKCSNWLVRGYCNKSIWKPFMMDSCAKTCEFCQEEEIFA